MLNDMQPGFFLGRKSIVTVTALRAFGDTAVRCCTIGSERQKQVREGEGEGEGEGEEGGGGGGGRGWGGGRALSPAG